MNSTLYIETAETFLKVFYAVLMWDLEITLGKDRAFL